MEAFIVNDEVDLNSLRNAFLKKVKFIIFLLLFFLFIYFIRKKKH